MSIKEGSLQYHFPNKGEISISELIDNRVRNIKVSPLVPREKRQSEMKRSFFEEGLSRTSVAFNSYLRTLGLDGMDIQGSHKVNQHQIQSMLAHYYFMKKEGAVKETEKDIFISSCITILSLVKEYKETREKYLGQVQDELHDDLDKMNQEIVEEKRRFKEKRDLWERSKETMLIEKKEDKKRLLALEKSLYEVNKKNEQLLKEKEKFEENQKELLALREYVFSLKQDVEPIKECTSLEELVEKLNGKRITIIGGHINWQNKLKEVLKEVTFVTPDQEGANFSFLNNMDAVFLHTGWLNHGTYYKVQKFMSGNNVPLFYLSRKDNIEMIVSEISDKVFNKNK